MNYDQKYLDKKVNQWCALLLASCIIMMAIWVFTAVAFLF